MYVHIFKYETLEEAYLIAKNNRGVEGIDGVTFDYIEENGRSKFFARYTERTKRGHI